MRVENISIFDEAKLQKAQKAAGVSFASMFASEFVNPKLETQAEHSLDKDIIDASNIFIDRFNDSRLKAFDNDLTKINANISKQSELTKTRVFNSLNFGYSVDNDGFMGADFNKAAGLADDFKIHSSTLKEIVRFNEKMNVYSVMKDSGKTFSNIDLADTIKHYYDLFTQITHNNQDYPSGISIDFGYSKVSFDYINDVSKYKITNIYKNNEELEYAKSIKADGFSVIELSFEPKNISVDKELAFSPDFSMYNEKEKKFIGFLQSINPFASASGTTRLSKDALKYALAMQDDYNNINKDIKKHKDLLKMANEIKHLGIDELLKTNTEVAKFLDKTKV